MKKSGILNSEISRVLSYMGHTDTLCISDCGLPIPDEVERIDLALTLGTPSFMDTLKAVSEDMKIEKIILAEEIKEKNPKLYKELMKFFGIKINKKGAVENADIEVEFVSHSDFKLRTWDSKAIIRTGENTPYANIILQSACIF